MSENLRLSIAPIAHDALREALMILGDDDCADGQRLRSDIETEDQDIPYIQQAMNQALNIELTRTEIEELLCGDPTVGDFVGGICSLYEKKIRGQGGLFEQVPAS